MTIMVEEDQLTATFVSDLERAYQLQDDDLFMISQDEGDGLVSKSLEYSTLCSKVLADVDEKVDARIAEHVDELSGSIVKLSSDLSTVSNTVDQNVSATIKIANCVKKAKEDIAEHQAIFDGISGINGIGIDKTSAHNWKIKHTNSVAAATSPVFAKIQYDSQGHITGKSSVTLADLTAAAGGSLLTAVGQGLSAQNGRVALSSAASNQLGGVKLGYTQSGKNYPLTVDTNGKAYTNVPYPDYTVGEGLSASGTRFSLSGAAANQLGGVKLGYTQSGKNYPLTVDTNGKAYTNVPWSDTTYSNATASTAGLVKVFGSFTQNKRYPLAISSNGYAYVDVPWVNGAETIGDSTLTANEFAILTSISTRAGELTSLGTSTALYTKFQTVSSDVYNVNIPKLRSGYLGSTTTTMTYDVPGKTLYLKLNGTTVAQTQIAIGDAEQITACQYQTQVQDEETILTGNYLVFYTNNENSFWCDITELMKNTAKNYLKVVTTLPTAAQADPDIYYFKVD